MDTVVVHDGTVHPGGAVHVVLEMTRSLDADLVVGFSGREREWWTDRAENDVRILSGTSKLDVFRDVRNAYRMMNLALEEYDVVVTSGPASKFFQPYDQQLHVHYLHHPPLGKLWFGGGLFAYLQTFVDRLETTSIPVVVANSELTADRFWKHYGREVHRVVNPPVDTETFSRPGEHRPGKFVMVGRLEERKRPLLAVAAFEELQSSSVSPTPELHLVGDGPLAREVRRRAPENVVVHGYVEEDELVTLLSSADAGIFLAEREDFGITPVEYMAAGLPVLGVDEPNTNNQVDSGVTGVLVAPAAPAVREGVVDVMNRAWDRERIAERARSYDTERFHDEIREAVTDG